MGQRVAVTAIIFAVVYCTVGFAASARASSSEDVHVLNRAIYAVQTFFAKRTADYSSYRMITTSVNQGPVETVSYARGERIMTISPTVEMIDIGGTVSYSKDRSDGTWTKFELSSGSSSYERSTKASDLGPLPLHFLNGDPRAQFATVLVAVGENNRSFTAGKNTAVTCVYERGTFRIRSCKTKSASIRFDRYNDPSNKFEVPLAALRAPRKVIDSK